MGLYNCEKTIDEAILSIINQTCSDWEIVMCDDGSVDSTREIAQKYVEKDPEKFILLNNEKNIGLNLTLNKCLSVAKGEYIARMDADDISLATRFQEELEFLERHPEYAIVSTSMIYFDENGEYGKGKAIEKPQIDDVIYCCPVHCHAPCMIRKEAYLKVNGYSTDARTLRYEDCDLWFRLYAEGYRGYNIQHPLYKMRDDRNAYKRRSFRYRLNGIYVVKKGFEALGRTKKEYYAYALVKFPREIIKSLVPEKVYTYFHKKRLKGD